MRIAGLGFFNSFSRDDAEWMERTRGSSNSVVSVSHPDWRGIRSAARELFANCYYLDDSVTEASAKYYARLFHEAGIDKLVINGFPLSYRHLIDRVRKDAPQIDIYAIWHGSFLQSGEEIAWKGFQALLGYARTRQIKNLGFVKEGMAEVIGKDGVRTGFVMNMVQRVPQGPSLACKDQGCSKLGLWHIDNGSWRKLPFAMIAAAGAAKHCVLHLSGADQRSRELIALLGVSSVISDVPTPPALMPERLAEMHLNLYVTLSECAPMLPLESLSVGVPCLFGPNSHLFRDNEFLHDRLVVPYPDSASTIARFIDRALEDRAEIVAEYIRYAPDYNARARKSLADFLDA